MNIYLHELRAYWKNTVIWMAALGAGTLFMFSVYPAFSMNAAALSDALRNYPQMIQLAFGLMLAQMGSVGYWCGQPFARQGLTLAAVRALGEFSFRSLGLHRLEAACIPENRASRDLLAKAGFEEEGFAKAYLKINGAWRDHVLFGRTNPYARDDGPDDGVSV